MNINNSNNIKIKSKAKNKSLYKLKKLNSPHNTSSFLIKLQRQCRSSPGNLNEILYCQNPSEYSNSNFNCNLNNINFKESNIINNYTNNNEFNTYSLNLENELTCTGGTMIGLFNIDDCECVGDISTSNSTRNGSSTSGTDMDDSCSNLEACSTINNYLDQCCNSNDKIIGEKESEKYCFFRNNF